MKEVNISRNGLRIVVGLMLKGLVRYRAEFAIHEWSTLAYSITATWLLTIDEKPPQMVKSDGLVVWQRL